MDNTIIQFKKMVEEVEFSEDSKEKIDKILEDTKHLSEGEIEALEEIIKTDMILDSMEVKMNEDFLKNSDELFTELKEIVG